MKQLSFLDYDVIISGESISGWGEGADTFLARRLENSASHVVGNDGEMAVLVNSNRATEMVFRLLQTSTSNAIFNGLLNSMENGAFIPVAALFKDRNNGETIAGSKGYISGQPESSRGNAINEQTWTIILERGDFLLTGSENV